MSDTLLAYGYFGGMVVIVLVAVVCIRLGVLGPPDDADEVLTFIPLLVVWPLLAGFAAFYGTGVGITKLLQVIAPPPPPKPDRYELEAMAEVDALLGKGP